MNDVSVVVVVERAIMAAPKTFVHSGKLMADLVKYGL